MLCLWKGTYSSVSLQGLYCEQAFLFHIDSLPIALTMRKLTLKSVHKALNMPSATITYSPESTAQSLFKQLINNCDQKNNPDGYNKMLNMPYECLMHRTCMWKYHNDWTTCERRNLRVGGHRDLQSSRSACETNWPKTILKINSNSSFSHNCIFINSSKL